MTAPGASAAYLRRTISILEELSISQAEAIDRAAAAVADAIGSDPDPDRHFEPAISRSATNSRSISAAVL